jgi:hypothetical protein
MIAFLWPLNTCMNDTGLQFFAGYTLVDITATGVTRSTEIEQLERNQQRNWETVIQCLGLRTQPHMIQVPIILEQELHGPGGFEFGDMYTGVHRVWYWMWATERVDVYDLPNKTLGGLQEDFEQVPVVTHLSETARFMLPIFYPHGTIKNIYFKQINPN